MAYCALLVQEGVFEQIEVDYLIAGHTRFHPDRYLAWLSNVVKKSDFFSLSDYVEVVEKNCRKLQLKETSIRELDREAQERVQKDKRQLRSSKPLLIKKNGEKSLSKSPLPRAMDRATPYRILRYPTSPYL